MQIAAINTKGSQLVYSACVQITTMRFSMRYWRRYFIIIAAVNVIIFIILSLWQHQLTVDPSSIVDDSAPTPEIVNTIKPTLTVIIQDFDTFENHVGAVVTHLITNFDEVQVLVVSAKLPYPPIDLPTHKNVRLVTLENTPHKTLNDTRPETYIKTNFVLFVPDGVSIDIVFLEKFKTFVSNIPISKPNVYVIPVGHTPLKCHGLSFLQKTWTIEISNRLQSDRCGYITGEHGLLLQTQDLWSVSNPFLLPTFSSLYVQLSVISIKPTIISDLYLTKLKPASQDPQTIWQHKQSHNDQLRHLFAELGVKRVIRENGKTDWFGCSKETSRCFDTVHNDMPEYIYHGRYTPPCCLEHLRETAKHVFSILDSCKVRYWLEGGSLLGAARNKDIILWDYDIDIGIYQDDIIKCSQLAKIGQESFVDESGFSWEKAIEGDFFRVQFSETNHLHVDIFPFFSKDGIMTKNTWIRSHRQDTEFPEHFLKPLTRIEFAGLNASAPNNVRNFLEYKFGKGVIESPKYPNAKTVV